MIISDYFIGMIVGGGIVLFSVIVMGALVIMFERD